MIDAALLARGEALAMVDGVAYQAVRLVFACDPNEAPALYCTLDDWPASHAARLAAKDREISELAALNEQLAAKVLELTIQLAAKPVNLPAPLPSPIPKQEAQFRAQAAYLRDEPAEPPPDPIVCPDCGKDDLKSAKALQMHRQRAHQGMQAVRTDLIRVVAQPQQFVEELGWRCAAKGCTGAHARDMHDPLFCTLHAQPRTNGHEITA